MAKVKVAMVERNGKCLLDTILKAPIALKGLPLPSCMRWYVLVRSQIKSAKWEMYWSKSRTEFKKKKKKNQNTEQTFLTFGRGTGLPKSPWLLGLLIVTRFAIFGVVIYLFIMQHVWGSEGLMAFWKMCYSGTRRMPCCRPCHTYQAALVTRWGPAGPCSGAWNAAPSARPEPWWSHQLRNSSNLQLFMTILIAKV